MNYFVLKYSDPLIKYMDELPPFWHCFNLQLKQKNTTVVLAKQKYTSRGHVCIWHLSLECPSFVPLYLFL